MLESKKHEIINCSRCQNVIECKSNTPMQCECNNISLLPKEIEYITEQFFDGCLCANCLIELKKQSRINS